MHGGNSESDTLSRDTPLQFIWGPPTGVAHKIFVTSCIVRAIMPRVCYPTIVPNAIARYLCRAQVGGCTLSLRTITLSPWCMVTVGTHLCVHHLRNGETCAPLSVGIHKRSTKAPLVPSQGRLKNLPDIPTKYDNSMSTSSCTKRSSCPAPNDAVYPFIFGSTLREKPHCMTPARNVASMA